MHLVFFFFFSSRRRHTRLVSDWSSDVCSSDLLPFTKKRELSPGLPPASPGSVALPHWTPRGAHLRHSGFGDLNPTPFRSAEGNGGRSEEHTSELQSLTNLVCRLLLEKKKKKNNNQHIYSRIH